MKAMRVAVGAVLLVLVQAGCGGDVEPAKRECPRLVVDRRFDVPLSSAQICELEFAGEIVPNMTPRLRVPRRCVSLCGDATVNECYFSAEALDVYEGVMANADAGTGACPFATALGPSALTCAVERAEGGDWHPECGQR